MITSVFFCRCLALSGVIAFAALATGCGDSLELQSINRPIQFVSGGPIEGGDAVFRPGATILIGEIHGTWEIPIVVATLARNASAHGNKAVVCLEIPSSEQASIDRFLASDGGAGAIEALVKPPFWVSQDGRASVGVFAMLELIRQLRSMGQDVEVFAIDLSWSPPPDAKAVKDRDHTMAGNLVRFRRQWPDATVIALAGNVHTGIVRGAPWDEEYVPMGWFVAQSVPGVLTLKVVHAGGEAWGIRLDQSENTGAVRGKVSPTIGEDLGASPFIQIHEEPQSGYHGTLYVGSVSAAKPALAKSEE